MNDMAMGYHRLSVQIIGIIFALALIVSVFLLARRERIKEKYAIVWFMIGAFILIISIFKGLLEKISDLIGIYYAPSALFAILISCAYLLLLNMSISISTLKKQNKRLTQELGLMKIKLEEREKKDEKN